MEDELVLGNMVTSNKMSEEVVVVVGGVSTIGCFFYIIYLGIGE